MWEEVIWFLLAFSKQQTNAACVHGVLQGSSDRTGRRGKAPQIHCSFHQPPWCKLYHLASWLDRPWSRCNKNADTDLSSPVYFAHWVASSWLLRLRAIESSRMDLLPTNSSSFGFIWFLWNSFTRLGAIPVSSVLKKLWSFKYIISCLARTACLQ